MIFCVFFLQANRDFDGELAVAGVSHIVTTRKLISAGSWDSGLIPQKQFAPFGEDEYS